eukprot:TRINITY_DN2588_c0_g1_i1.p1 TRINITY_DN2588_c0_g1~~TRINITY_DN2588_c0_g1_i1.p1  ORF type:complete len:413 (+),score=139.67 TRINITY_DN2588_c0_g1_i1:36-1274(+)
MTDYPSAEHFDSSDAIASGNFAIQGKKITLSFRAGYPLTATIMKSDVAIVSIPELEVEEAPGVARFISVEDFLSETYHKIRSASSQLHPSQMQRMALFIDYMEQMMEGRQPFTLIIDDPLGMSFVNGAEKIQVATNHYERSWAQNQELGLLTLTDPITDYSEGIDKILELIQNSNHIVGFTGAGISVESGVPAFRGSPDSIWSRYNDADNDYNNFLTRDDCRTRYWQMKTEFYDILQKTTFNPSHKIFAALHKQGKLDAIITQNIDSLHVRAGVPEDKIISLHGTESVCHCLTCGDEYKREIVHLKIKCGENVPRCHCGGLLKPATIFFGERLKEDVIRQAEQALRECDLIIVMGTSLVVQPANRLPQISLGRGVPMVIINLEKTQYDDYATVVLHAKTGETTKDIIEKMVR